jgi:hypothetical protein
MGFKNILVIILSVIVVGAIIFFSIEENKKPKERIDLKLQLKAGESHEFKITHRQETLETYQDQQRKVNTHAEIVAGLEVSSVEPNGTMNVDFIYKSFQLNINSDGEDVHYDSTKPVSADPNNDLLTAINDVYSTVIGTKLRIAVSPLGKVNNTGYFDEVRKKMEALIKGRVKQEIAKMTDPNTKNKAMLAYFQERQYEMAKNMTTEMTKYYNRILASIITDTQEAIGYIIIQYPDEQMFTGDKWYDKTRLNLNLPVDANITYIFKRLENGSAYIDTIHDVDMGGKLVLTDVESQGKISKCISGARTATNSVNGATGLLERSEAVMKFTGKQKIEPDNPIVAYHIRPRDVYAGFKANISLQSGAVIPITIEGTTIIELIK